ncbi:hypothetical protein Q7C36_000515 [Tachysurus vachellii]|uniref:Uncharacterized protein n=1 Tax=Tachysurus vachellii TaxID=175792 RepID=A0AA88PA24_TACVA|nr:hypothetical protein Q7C36_000515 [Tachysurus vachellii]
MQIWERSCALNIDERKCHGEGWRLHPALGSRFRCRLGMLAELVGHGSVGQQSPGSALRLKNELQLTTCPAQPSDTTIHQHLIPLRDPHFYCTVLTSEGRSEARRGEKYRIVIPGGVSVIRDRKIKPHIMQLLQLGTPLHFWSYGGHSSVPCLVEGRILFICSQWKCGSVFVPEKDTTPLWGFVEDAARQPTMQKSLPPHPS